MRIGFSGGCLRVLEEGRRMKAEDAAGKAAREAER